MADRKPLKVLPDGGGDSTGLSEFRTGDTIGVANGGTGLTTVATSNLLTGNGADPLSAEANLTFDGTRLGVNNTSPSTVDGNTDVIVVGDGNANADVIMYSPTGGNSVLGFTDTADTTNQGFIQYLHGSDNALKFGTSGTERMRILSGGGIAFNGDTATANALDDYEEGTWTGVLWHGGLAYSMASGSVATYTKIGRQVTCLFSGQATSNDGWAHGLSFKGLPFTSANNTGQENFGILALEEFTRKGAEYLTYVDNSNVMDMHCFLGANSTTLSLVVYLKDGGTRAGLDCGDIYPAPNKISISITYFV